MTQVRRPAAQEIASSRHVAQLFDDIESLAETVAEFVREGWQRHEPLLVVARPETWSLTSSRLVAGGFPIDEATASGRLVVLDAAATLTRFLRNGHLFSDRFDAHVGQLVRRLGERFGRRVRVYGEMVDILAAQGDLATARQLEHLWNGLGSSSSITLLCGYASGNFGDPRTAEALRAICSEHDVATAKPTDLLGAWLLSDRQSRFHTAT